MLSGPTARGWSTCLALAFFVLVGAVTARAGQPDPAADRSGGSAGSLPPGPSSDNGTSGYDFYRPGEALRDAHDPLVATVEGRNIYLSDIGDAYRALPGDTRQQSADLLYPTLLQGLVSQSALFLEARRQELDADPEVRRRMVKAMELTLVSELLNRTITAKVTEAAIRARYQEQYANAASGDQLHLRVIVVSTEAAREQTVPVRDQYDISRPPARRSNGTSYQVGPGIYVRLGVSNDCWFTGGPARSMNANYSFARHGKHLKRIVLTKIVLNREREQRDIGQVI